MYVILFPFDFRCHWSGFTASEVEGSLPSTLARFEFRVDHFTHEGMFTAEPYSSTYWRLSVMSTSAVGRHA